MTTGQWGVKIAVCWCRGGWWQLVGESACLQVWPASGGELATMLNHSVTSTSTSVKAYMYISTAVHLIFTIYTKIWIRNKYNKYCTEFFKKIFVIMYHHISSQKWQCSHLSHETRKAFQALISVSNNDILHICLWQEIGISYISLHDEMPSLGYCLMFCQSIMIGSRYSVCFDMMTCLLWATVWYSAHLLW